MHIASGIVPYIRSSPGLGKSSIFRQIAEDFDLEFIDIRLSMFSPLDLNGLPHVSNGKASFIPFDLFPTENTPIPKGKVGWLILFDEINSIPAAVEAAAYKIMLEKYVGNAKLHPSVYIAAAGNLDTDKAITRPSSSAMLSRMSTIFMELDTSKKNHVDEFFEDVVIKYNWHPLVAAYLTYMPQHINTFSNTLIEKAYAVPRTWEFINNSLKFSIDNAKDVDVIGTTIGYSTAYSFVSFVKNIEGLPKPNEIAANPDKIDISNLNAAQRYGLISSIIGNTDSKTIKPYLDFVARDDVGIEYKALYCRSVNRRFGSKYQYHPAMIDASVTVAEYLAHDRD